MSVPAVVVRFELERAPVVYSDATSESEAMRLADWLREHPDWFELLRRAREFATEQRAA
ncbi:MAG: hypothetical protein ABSB24_02810 [Gaiellaceae bacterium]|jgi:hypothetical protein